MLSSYYFTHNARVIWFFILPPYSTVCKNKIHWTLFVQNKIRLILRTKQINAADTVMLITFFLNTDFGTQFTIYISNGIRIYNFQDSLSMTIALRSKNFLLSKQYKLLKMLNYVSLFDVTLSQCILICLVDNLISSHVLKFKRFEQKSCYKKTFLMW